MPIPNAVLEAEKRATQFIEEGNKQQPTIEQQPPAAPPPAPAPVESPPAPTEGSAEYWKSRFHVVEGKLNTEVPRLHEQLRQTTDRLQALEQAPPKPIEKPKLVTEDEVREYTPEFVDMIERAAEQRVAQLLAERDARLSALETKVDTVGQTVVVTAKERYLADLDKLFPPQAEGQLPYWRVLNDENNQPFYDWLAEIDPISGSARMVGMRAADAALDVERVARILRAYLREHGAQAPLAPSTPSHPHNAQILPTPTQGSPTPTGAPSGKIWRRSEINAFYDAERRGVYRTRLDEFRRQEADIFAAQAENRVVDG